MFTFVVRKRTHIAIDWYLILYNGFNSIGGGMAKGNKQKTAWMPVFRPVLCRPNFEGNKLIVVESSGNLVRDGMGQFGMVGTGKKKKYLT